MKNVTFEGKKYKVPFWVKYISRDFDGDIYCFESKPYMDAEGRFWNTDCGRKILLLEEHNNWKDSLIRV